jgi:hypothetical protein
MVQARKQLGRENCARSGRAKTLKQSPLVTAEIQLFEPSPSACDAVTISHGRNAKNKTGFTESNALDCRRRIDTCVGTAGVASTAAACSHNAWNEHAPFRRNMKPCYLRHRTVAPRAHASSVLSGFGHSVQPVVGTLHVACSLGFLSSMLTDGAGGLWQREQMLPDIPCIRIAVSAWIGS